MGGVTYKCPNCGGGLAFNAEKQKYKCEYCLSEFSREELDEIEKRELEKARKQAEVQRDPEPEGAGSEAGTEEHVSGSKKTVPHIMCTPPSCWHPDHHRRDNRLLSATSVTIPHCPGGKSCGVSFKPDCWISFPDR